MPLDNRDLEMLKAWFELKALPFDKALLEKIANYHDLILSWSKRINLVSKKDVSQIIENHFLDSLGGLELISSGSNIIDIGSGAGFPGIPLALINPNLKITLLESVHKKVLFLRAAKNELRLENVRILEGRLEKLKSPEAYDIVTIRALPKWESYLGKFKKLLKEDGKIIYYKYRGVYEEIKG